LLNRLASYRHGALAACAQARPLVERALAINEKALGPEHPSTATSLNNLAALLRDQGDLVGARPLAERALPIYEETLGCEHAWTATSLDSLAQLLQVQGDFRGRGRSMAICENVLGPEHPSTATSLNNLAGLLRDQGDFSGARPLHERALAIREKALGREHPDTAQSFNNLAACFSLRATSPGHGRSMSARWRSLRRRLARSTRTPITRAAIFPGCCWPLAIQTKRSLLVRPLSPRTKSFWVKITPRPRAPQASPPMRSTRSAARMRPRRCERVTVSKARRRHQCDGSGRRVLRGKLHSSLGGRKAHPDFELKDQ